MEKIHLDFIKRRLHWGGHLPIDVQDGLWRIVEDRAVNQPTREEINALFDALTLLERRETREGRCLTSYDADDQLILTEAEVTVRSIVRAACERI
jgi:hypothetical protein